MSEKGFTFIELMVVLALVGVLLAVTVPKVRENLTEDRLGSAARKIASLSRELRSEAARENEDSFLRIDLDRGCFWKFRSSLSPEKSTDVKKYAFCLPADVLIVDAHPYGQDKKKEGETAVRFSRKGYAQPAVIHLAHGDRQVTVVIQPFLNAVAIHADYVDLWEKEEGAKTPVQMLSEQDSSG
ncbi:MAG: prepilin-type N-terminal cleavage/methylation domain-containing protein [Syntrophales bacterium]|nr:prepilin-type N-terminal cleavage/methylation domain-containing protein [Syntrophales bacterium]MDD5233136.1 prepilin-type N-terminal cleavage/methylation domain-containing protein [Syntrophales bacterium]MDD5531322.1 prepilin-type N-terminal cleavage/methylation domain-containing protein [Syntrophales bacterium]